MMNHMEAIRAIIQWAIDGYNHGMDEADRVEINRNLTRLDGMQAILKAIGITLETENDRMGYLFYKLS